MRGTYIFHNVAGTRKKSRCGGCQGCTEQQDCGTCINCKDKPKFGGPGRKKQYCVKCKCKYELLRIKLKSLSPLIHIQSGIQLAKRAKTGDTATLESEPGPVPSLR